MEKAKREIEEIEADEPSFWALTLQWFLTLLLVAAIVLAIMVIVGPIIGNVFSDVIRCLCG